MAGSVTSQNGFEFSLAGVRRLAVFRALQLGDLLCSIPAVRALRRAAPNAEVILVGLPWSRALIDRYPEYFDGFIEFPGMPGLPEREPDCAAFPAFLSEMRALNLDLVIQMHGSGALVNSLCALFAAKRVAGYFEAGGYCPDAATCMPYPDDCHEIRRHLKLAAFLGAADTDETLEFPIGANDEMELDSALDGREIAGPFVCVHPGARYLSRRWLPERFAAVADDLAGEGYDVVLTGSAEEAGLVEIVSRQMSFPHVNLAGRTSLGAAGALVARANLVITNDTGMSHLAAAVGVPSVVILLGSDARRWAPLDRQRHRLVSVDVPCQPCEHRICPIHFPCAQELRSGMVIEAARELLRSPSGPRPKAFESLRA